MHKVFLGVGASLSLLALLGSFLVISDKCSMAFMLWYTLFWLGQGIQHFLSFTIPQVDTLKHEHLIRRFVGIVIIIDILYFFLAFTFWMKSEYHPLYCFLCHRIGLSPLIGVFLLIHFFIALAFFIQFLYAYIKRKYYLISLGGFTVEQRLLREREESRRRLGLLEPMSNDYPLPIQHKNPNNYYLFNDVADEVTLGMCSICLCPNEHENKSIMTLCNHMFHRTCIENWAKINDKCPDCRTPFTPKRNCNNNSLPSVPEEE